MTIDTVPFDLQLDPSLEDPFVEDEPCLVCGQEHGGDTDGDFPPLATAEEVGEPPALVEEKPTLTRQGVIDAIYALRGEVRDEREIRLAEIKLLRSAIAKLQAGQEKLRLENQALAARIEAALHAKPASGGRPAPQGKPAVVPELPVLGRPYGRVEIEGKWVSLNCNGQSVEAVREYQARQKAA